MTRILVVDDEAFVRKSVRAALKASPETVYEAESGASALQLLASHPGPWIVLLDWIIPEPDGFAVCRLIREQFTQYPPYVILMSSRAGRAEVAQGIQAGADEFLAKPLAPDLLRSRIRAARRRMAGDRPPSRLVLDKLREAEREGTGELIIRDQERISRVLFHEGRVCWITISDDAESFGQMLSKDGVEADELQAALSEARRTGQGFYDVLLNWGLLSRERLREVALSWTSRRMQSLLSCQGPQAMFIPNATKGDAHGFSFKLSELLSQEALARAEAVPELSVLPPAQGLAAWQAAFQHLDQIPQEVTQCLDGMMEIHGAVSAAVIDRQRGQCEGWVGTPLDPGLVWANIQALNAFIVNGNHVDDLVLSTEQNIHLLRTTGEGRVRLCYLVVNRPDASMGMARASLARVIGT